MLVQLLVLVADPELRRRASGLRGGDLRLTIAEPEGDPSHILAQVAPDVLLLDREGLGPHPKERIQELRSGGTGPDLLYVAVEEEPDERAELLANGCLAIVEGRAAELEFGQAVLGVVNKWRKTEIRKVAAGRQRQDLHLGDFLTASPSMEDFMVTARRVSSSDTSVLILGETGVGKERLALAIHASGRRRDNPMVVVNCGAIPENLFESELFGHERGAFTGAERTRRGYFELAHGGTIFLDEIGEMPVHMQVKLLRVLQERQINRVGSATPIPVDVRVIAATSRNLPKEMEEKRFRPDLFYRLSVVSLTIPPLRERIEDVSLLAEACLERFRKELRAQVRSISPQAMQALTAYHWPGNVREVVNVIERAVLLCDEDEITLDDLPERIAAGFIPSAIERLVDRGVEPAALFGPELFRLSLRDARHAWNAAFERLYLQRTLRETRGKIGLAAKRIGIDPRSLYTKMKEHGLRKEDFRG